MSFELAKAYDPKQVEAKWSGFWLENNLFRAEDRPRKGKKGVYCIVIPPPNVTGVLHMGHALNNTLQDVLIRWKRMKGFETLWQPGTDHAGIATQNVVEREILKAEGKTRHQIGREELTQRIWKWKEQYGDRIIEQLHALGASCDWSRTRFTLDEGLSEAVRECFVQLYKKKLIYRGNYIVSWCPRCQTALADDEVEYEEKKGNLWHIRYPFKETLKEYVVVATTRPETMLGDVAVAVNPKDKRYQKLIEKKLLLPEVGREIPIITDDFVDPKFGSGCVKVTPAHDPNDFQIGLRHNLEQINVFDASAILNQNAPKKYQGMKREECRKALVQALEEQGLIDKIEEHLHSVGHCYRCHTMIEPWLSKQWFVKMKPLARKAIAATKKGRVKFFPKRWTKFYLSWLDEVRDWCISRQIWWGHQIPVWYCAKDCEPIAAKETPKKCPACGGKDLKQEEDVLDTWFSSQLWPFSTLGWPEKTVSLKTYYPNDVLITDRGIIFFWVARMVMMGMEMMGQEPFGHVYIHGTILDKLGRKMSKSHPETCIDPLDIIERYGADALRYSLLLLATEGQDLKIDESKFETGRHFCNKLWNATRFAMMNLENYDGKEDAEKKLTLADQWIWNRLQVAIQSINSHLENYHYFDAAQTLYKFVWNEFCDWYLELIKPTVANSHATQWNLFRVLDTILKVAHPFLPFITEELWQHLNETVVVPGQPSGRQGTTTVFSIVTSAFPQATKKKPFAKEAKAMETVQSVIHAIRNLRGEHGVNPRQPIPVFIVASSKSEERILSEHQTYLKNLAQLSDLQFLRRDQKPEKSAIAVCGKTQIFVPFRELFDLQAEKDRLEKELAKTKEDISRFESKLANKSFVERAPKAVVDQERLRLSEHQERLKKLQGALDQLR